MVRKKKLRLIGNSAGVAVIAISGMILFAGFCSAGEKAEKGGGRSGIEKSASGVHNVNLGDYAKGDGTDETDAIQKAFDDLVPRKEGWKPHLHGYPHRDIAGVLFIPQPEKFYGISRTISIYEKWNVLIECETPGYQKRYFRWLGPEGGTMFEFVDDMGVRVEKLSMDGMGKGVTGIRIGPENRRAGHFKYSSFSSLFIANVGVGMKLGDFPDNGPDIAHNSYRDVFISRFSQYGVMARSGNLANNTFMNLSLAASDGAIEGIRMDGGELLVLHSCLGGGPSDTKGAAVAVYAGGVQVISSWSEWKGPLLYGHTQAPESGRTTSSTVRYPTKTRCRFRLSGIGRRRCIF